MASLYNISRELISLFDEIEQAGGEITPEQELNLMITEEDLRQKLTQYAKAVNNWKTDVDACKCEEKRIKDLRKVKENRIERLKSIMLNAVENFGDIDKKGVCHIELPTMTLSTRKSTAVEMEYNRADILINIITQLVSEWYAQGVLYTGEDTDIQGILDSVNAVHKSECELIDKEYIPFTLEDLTQTKVAMTDITTISEMFIRHGDGLRNVLDNSGNISFEEDKTAIKNYLSIVKNSSYTIAKIKNNKSLIMK